MYLKYDLDITKDSVWIINTPTVFERKQPFYMNECGRFLARKNYYTIREGKEDYLMVFCLAGRGGVEYNGVTHELTPNTFMLVDCRNRSYFYSLEDKWHFYFMHFNGDGADNFASILQNLEFASITHPETFHAEMNQIFLNSKINDVSANINIGISIYKLFAEIASSAIAKKEPVNNTDYGSEIQSVLQFINDEMSSKITLDDMMSLVHISKFHFIRVFKQYVGTSPYKYLQTVRISRAKIMLRESNCPVSEIAVRTGFPDVNNFIRIFKALSGITPMQYKRSFDEDIEIWP